MSFATPGFAKRMALTADRSDGQGSGKDKGRGNVAASCICGWGRSRGICAHWGAAHLGHDARVVYTMHLGSAERGIKQNKRRRTRAHVCSHYSLLLSRLEYLYIMPRV